MAKIKQLLGADEKVFFPQTHQKAVIDNNGNSLVEVFKEQHDEALKLRDTHSNRLGDLERSLFYIKSTLTPNQVIYKKGNTSYSDCYVDIRLDTNHPDMLTETGLLDRNYVLAGETRLTTSSTNITFNPEDTVDKNTTRVRFQLANTDTTGYASYKLSLVTKARWTDGSPNWTEKDKPDPNEYSINFQCSTSTEFIQVAPSYIGWSTVTKASEDIITNKDSILEIVWNTDISGVYTFSKVPKNYLFWIIVPKSNKFSGYSSVTTNNTSVLMTNYEEVTINGVSYFLTSNASGILQVGDLDWKMILE